jgi:hypothetical protein
MAIVLALSLAAAPACVGEGHNHHRSKSAIKRFQKTWARSHGGLPCLEECALYRKEGERFVMYQRCGGCQVSELRAAVRSYGILTDDVRRTKNRLRAVYRSRGIATPGKEVFRPETHERWERELPAPQRESAALLQRQLELVTELWEGGWVRTEFAGHGSCAAKVEAVAVPAMW